MATKVIPTSSRLIGGIRFNLESSLTGNSGIGFLDSAGSSQGCITVNGTTSTISLRTGNATGVAVATSGASVTVGSTHYLEWDITFGNSARYQVWLDGVSIISGTGDTTATANNNVGSFTIIGMASSNILIFDDLYLFDTSGTTNNAVLLTSPRIETTFPTADSAHTVCVWRGDIGVECPASDRDLAVPAQLAL